MTTEPAGMDRCPKCGAAVRFGDPWCTLCYADLRPPATPAPAPPALALPALVEPQLAPRRDPLTDPLTDPFETSAAPRPAATGPDPLAAPLDAVTGPSWPCSACGAVNPMARDTCSACGVHFLAAVRADDRPLLELPLVGDITRHSRGARFALAGGVVLAFLLVTLLLGVLFG